MQISITTNFPEVQRQIDALRNDLAAKATARAVNRTIEQARTQMSRQIRAEFNVDAGFVASRLRIKRATFFRGLINIEATLDATAKTRSANVIRFAAKSGKRGVTVKIKRTGGRKLIAGTFIGNKGRTVFERVEGTRMQSRKPAKRGTGAHQQQIRPVQTINVPQMFTTKRINAAVVAAMQARFPAIFEREVAFLLSAFNRG